MTDLVIVPLTEVARPFVIDSFVRSYADAANGGRDGLPAADLAQLLYRWRDPASGARALHHYAELMLARSTTYLASAAESPNVYIGWMSASGDTLEYVYVKRAARRLGIARDLMAHHEQTRPLLTRMGLITWPWTARLVESRSNDPFRTTAQ